MSCRFSVAVNISKVKGGLPVTHTHTYSHTEHGNLDCKHFNTQTHTALSQSALYTDLSRCLIHTYTLTDTHSASAKATLSSFQAHTHPHPHTQSVHTHSRRSLTPEHPKHTLHSRSINYIADPFLPPSQN